MPGWEDKSKLGEYKNEKMSREWWVRENLREKELHFLAINKKVMKIEI